MPSHYFSYFLFFLLHFIFLSSCLSPHYLSICFLLPPQTHRRSARAQPPQTHCRRPTLGHRPTLTHLGLSSLFSAFVLVSRRGFRAKFWAVLMFWAGFLFWAWVLVWVCVSGMSFGLGLCFGLTFILSFCRGLFFVRSHVALEG